MFLWFYSGYSYGGRKDGSETSGGDERVEIRWCIVIRRLGFIWWIGREPEDDGGIFCRGVEEV